MLSTSMVEKLNAQINLEFYSSNLYLQMAAWCAWKGYEGSASFLQRHAAEEMMHAHRLFQYVNETGALAVLGRIDAPPTAYASLKDVFAQTYEHELEVTKSINTLAHAAFAAQDYSTFNFLQWYVGEQHEEETLFKGILDRFDLVGEDGKGLFFVDREIAQLAAAKPAPGQPAAPGE